MVVASRDMAWGCQVDCGCMSGVRGTVGGDGGLVRLDVESPNASARVGPLEEQGISL